MSILSGRYSSLLKSTKFWWAIAFLGTGLFGAALYWQHVLGEDPCQVCVHARLWVLAIAFVGIIMALVPRTTIISVLGHLSLLGSAFGLGERAYYLYEIENFRGDGSCEFTLGMPYWFAVDRWLPSLFEVRNICSYTPTVAFGISMAEILIAVSLLLCLTSAVAVTIHVARYTS